MVQMDAQINATGLRGHDKQRTSRGQPWNGLWSFPNLVLHANQWAGEPSRSVARMVGSRGPSRSIARMVGSRGREV